MWIFNVFGLLQLADSTNIKISFGFSSFSELKKFFLLLLLSLYWVFLFFFFWLWDLSSPPIHPVVETWSPNHWTPRGFSSGVTWRKSEWSIYTLKIVTYTIIPTQVLSTGQGLYMWFRKEGKEWEAITVYCWLFTTGWSEVGVTVPVLKMKKLRLQGESCPGSQRWKSWHLDLGLSWLWTCAFSSSPPLPVLVTDSTSNVFS